MVPADLRVNAVESNWHAIDSYQRDEVLFLWHLPEQPVIQKTANSQARCRESVQETFQDVATVQESRTSARLRSDLCA